MTGDKDTDIAAILASAGVDTAAAAGATVNAVRGFNNSSVTLSVLSSTVTNQNLLHGERYTIQPLLLLQLLILEMFMVLTC